jgi:hypothetical protein
MTAMTRSRGRVLNTEAFATAAAIAAVLVDNAIPTAAPPAGARSVEHATACGERVDLETEPARSSTFRGPRGIPATE